MLALPLLYGPPVAVMALLWWASSRPAPDAIGGHDKLAHLLAFGGLAALWARALWFGTTGRWLRVGLLAVGIAAAYGVVDEFHQSFVSGRDASVDDAVADLLGAVVGGLVTAGLYATFSRGAPGART